MTQTSNDQSQRFIHAALAASDDCIKIIGLDGSLQFMNEGGQRVMEIQDFEAVKAAPGRISGKERAISQL